MARRYSSTETNDLQLFSCVHILIFWLISWKTNKGAQSKVILFCNPKVYKLSYSFLHTTTGKFKWNQAGACCGAHCAEEVWTKITQGFSILQYTDKQSSHNTSFDLIKWIIRALLFGKIVIWYAIVSRTNIPLEYHPISLFNQFRIDPVEYV